MKRGAGRAVAQTTTEMSGGELRRSASPSRERIGSEAGGPNQQQVWKVSDEKAMKDKVSVEGSARAAAGLPGTARRWGPMETCMDQNRPVSIYGG